MRIAWISAAAYASTGYGRQTYEIVSRLIKMGYEVYNIGGIGGATVWGGKLDLPTRYGVKIPILPTMGQIGGRDVLEAYIKRYKFDLVITLWDCFAIDYTSNLKIPAINYLPIDAPFTKKMYKYIKNAFRVVAFSKFGYQELLKWFPPTRVNWIPHGIDTKLYRPYGEKEKRRTRESLTPTPVPEDAFLILDVAANVGERKQMPLLMHAFKKFLKKHDDAYLYLFSNPVMAYPRGYDLLALADQLGIRERICYPSLDPILDPWKEEDMAKLYSAADVLVTPTIGEGFGLPILEAQACGTPVIMTNCSTAPELVGGHGWLIDTIPTDEYIFYPVWIPTLQAYPVPNMKSLLQCLEDAYNHPEKVEEYGKMSRKFALNYDWSKVMWRWDKLLKEVEEELETFKHMMG